MKLLTLNTHSLVGEDFERRAEICVAALLREAPDVIALQEVNQSRSAPVVLRRSPHLVGDGEIPLRQDLYVKQMADALAAAGLRYDWRWLPVKVGYGRYDEGLGFLCRTSIAEVGWARISRTEDYENWRRRAALWIRPEGDPVWFCNWHASWWGDEEEPFLAQWERLLPHLRGKETVYLMGDTNNPAELRKEGYDRICADGFCDTYRLARDRRGEGTVRGEIDGWHGKMIAGGTVRIDQIFCSRPCAVEEYRTVFDGTEYETVSDHFGVTVTVGKGETKT